MATTDQVFTYDLVMGVLSDEVAPLFPAAKLEGEAVDLRLAPGFVLYTLGDTNRS